MRKGLLVLLMAIVMTGQAKAEEPECVDGKTMPGCFGTDNKEWADWAEWRAQESTAAVNTGVSGLLSPAQSTAKDFLSMLTAAFAAPMTGDGPRPVSLAWNFKIPLFPKERINVQAVFAKPQMSRDLEQRISGDAAAVAAVNDSISEFDDLTLRASFGPSTKRFGRSATPHRDAYMDILRQHLETATTSAATIQTATEAEVNQFAEQFAVLLNNQEQLYGEVAHRALKNVAGPDERSARITYEKGFHNLKEFYDGSGCDTGEPATDAARKSGKNCVTLLMEAADAAKAASEDRLAASIEYRSWNAWNVFLPDLADFSAPRARSFVYSVTYGRNRMMIPNGRLDIEVNYEDTTARTVTDAVPPALLLTGDASEAVRDRFVASATYTYKINGQMTMPLTLTYANHGRFLGDVDRKLNAHFGLSFKMPTPR